MYPALKLTETPIREERCGERLRRLRLQLGLTTREIAIRTKQLANELGNEDYTISHARLVQIENADSVPSIYKLFALSVVYGVSIDEMLRIYVDLSSASRLHQSQKLPATHRFSIATSERKPVSICFSSGLSTDRADGPREASGTEPNTLVDHIRDKNVRYAVIGSSDYTMYPLIQPGSVVQLEECTKPVKAARYQNEYERPIYVIELRSGYLCSWCELEGNRLICIPHSLSPSRVRVFSYPNEAEIIGRVTGVALRLTGGRTALRPQPMTPAMTDPQVFRAGGPGAIA
jgi:transcriptional regulator with XRE-family HTH domain